MKRGIEQPEFNGPFGKDTVQIQGMVAGPVIVVVPMAAPVVPQPFQLIQTFRPLPVDIIQKAKIGFLAVSLSADRNP
mgnify:CR=1 FL=1